MDSTIQIRESFEIVLFGVDYLHYFFDWNLFLFYRETVTLSIN